MQQRTYARRFMMGLLSLGLLVGAAVLAGPTQAATSNGPYYAEPAWDQKLPAATRFIVLSDWGSAAVLDRETGLVWEQAPPSANDWNNAHYACVFKSTGGRFGWRLPAISELSSLLDPGVGLPLNHPFTIQSAVYWSASTSAIGPAYGWRVIFPNGIVSIALKNLSGQVWCVRGGMNADAH